MKKFKLLSLILCLWAGTLHAKELNMSYVKSPFNLQLIVMKEKNILQDALKEKGVSLKWHEITSGAKQAQALASGDLDVAGVMNNASILMANGVGNPVKIISGVSRPVDTFALVSKKNGAISVKELKGKTVAGPKGTVLHQMLVAALKKENMTMNDINFVQMGLPQAYTALQAGKIDAALLAAGLVINAEKNGAKVITTAKGNVTPILAMTTSKKFIQENPELVELVVKAHNDSWNWIQKNKNEAIKIGAKVQNISIDDANKLYDWAHFNHKLNSNDIKSLYEDIDFMIENKMMTKKIKVEEIIFDTAKEI